MKVPYVSYVILVFIVGFASAFILLWGFSILPETIWQWSAKPLYMTGNISAPVLISLPCGEYIFVRDFTVVKENQEWYLNDYQRWYEGKWFDRSCNQTWVFQIKDNYDILYLPAEIYPLDTFNLTDITPKWERTLND